MLVILSFLYFTRLNKALDQSLARFHIEPYIPLSPLYYGLSARRCLSFFLSLSSSSSFPTFPLLTPAWRFFSLRGETSEERKDFHFLPRCCPTKMLIHLNCCSRVSGHPRNSSPDDHTILCTTVFLALVSNLFLCASTMLVDDYFSARHPWREEHVECTEIKFVMVLRRTKNRTKCIFCKFVWLA